MVVCELEYNVFEQVFYFHEENHKAFSCFQFLLQINDDGHNKYVIPYKFMSHKWPDGFYSGICDNIVINFTDDDIIYVVGKK